MIEKGNYGIEKINEEKIYYGGIPINKIFDNNFFNGEIQSGIDIYFTFKAKDVAKLILSLNNNNVKRL